MRWLPVLTLILASCSEEVESPFEDLPGAPADYVNSSYCSEGDTPGVLKRIAGEREEGGFWAEGGCCIAEDFSVLRARSLDWKLMQWANVKKYTVKKEDPPEGAAQAFRVSYVAASVIPASWEMKWIHTITAGTADEPQQIVIQYQKVKGTGFIKHWKGSFVLTRVKPGLTAFAMRFELQAVAQGQSAAEEAVELFHKKFVTGK